MKLTALDRLPKRLSRREQVSLSHELIERSGPHPVGEWPRRLGEPLPARAHEGSRARPRMRSAYTAQLLKPTPSSANATATPIASA